jgi:hypothetical protein
MRFAMLMYPGPQAYDPNTQPDPEMFKAMMAYNEELVAAGVMVSGEGLHGPAEAVRVKSGQVVIDGPFAESKEVLGGFWMLNVGSKAEAVEWARKVPLGEGDFVELRQVQEQEDFSEEIQAATKDSYDRIQSQLGQQH